MPNFTKPLPDLPHHLEGFTIAARVIVDDLGVASVALTFSVAVVAVSGRAHQLTGDLAPFLSAQQANAFTNAALALFTQAQAELLA